MAAPAPLATKSPKPTPIAPSAYRPLKAYAFDPSQGKYFGNYMTLNVKYEPLKPGPVGAQIAVIDYDASNDCYYEPVNLDDDAILIRNGLDPTESDPRFHQQMVYAVVKETIERFESSSSPWAGRFSGEPTATARTLLIAASCGSFRTACRKPMPTTILRCMPYCLATSPRLLTTR